MTAGRGDPGRSLRALGAAMLMLETIVVLLAAPALHSLGKGAPAAYGAVGALAVVLVVGSALQRRAVGVAVGTIAQVLVIAAGVISWPFFVLGAAFGGIWVGYLSLRRGLRPG